MGLNPTVLTRLGYTAERKGLGPGGSSWIVGENLGRERQASASARTGYDHAAAHPQPSLCIL